MRKYSTEWRSSATNKIITTEKLVTHSRKKEPVANMKLLLLFLLAGVCQTFTLIAERSWVKFRKVQYPAYNNSIFHGEPNIIHAMDILIEERINKISTMISNSLTDFQAHLKQYTTEVTQRIKRATTKQSMDL